MEDLISRQVAIDESYEIYVDGQKFEVVQVETLMGLPSAERPSGEWLARDCVFGVVYCSECGYELRQNDTNYCPNCGADMRGGDNEAD